MNCSFRNVEKQIRILNESTKISLAYTQEDAEMKNVSKLLSMLDLLQLQVKYCS